MGPALVFGSLASGWLLGEVKVYFDLSSLPEDSGYEIEHEVDRLAILSCA